MAERHGTVWYGERRVGTLREVTPQDLRFTYDTEWLASGGFPISIRLPLSLGDRETEAHAYFEGLLPEGRVRRRVCRQLGITDTDDVGLLLAIGEDCAGALSILPAESEPKLEDGPPKDISEEAIGRLIKSLGEDTSVLTGETPRFSLAGVQEKQPVIFDGRSYALPDRAHPSTHILKFETVPRVCFAECMANDMARRIGLPVADTEFLRPGSEEDAVPFLRIRRYDRERDAGGRLRRLHQEDLLQALGEPTSIKYQRDGGPTIGQVAEVLREHTARPVEALGRLRDWQIFNYLVGNWDGHGKNLALLYSFGEAVPALAPFYDLVAIEFLNLVRPHSWSRDMAFYIGANYIPEKIAKADWEQFARDLKMPVKPLFARLEDLAVRMPEVARDARGAFSEAHGDEAVHERLEESVRRRCHWTLNSVGTKTG